MSSDPQEDKQTRPKSTRGFASMDKERMREVASKGGKAAHAMGVAHQFTHDEAVAAGKKGGAKSSETYAKLNASRYSRMSTEELDRLIEKHDKAIEEQEHE